MLGKRRREEIGRAEQDREKKGFSSPESRREEEGVRKRKKEATGSQEKHLRVKSESGSDSPTMAQKAAERVDSE